MSLHRIARQSIDLRVGSEREAQDLHAELSARLIDRLSPVLAEVFDEACPDAVTIRIAALEIDAGVVPRDELVDVVVARAREQIVALLRGPESFAKEGDASAEHGRASGVERLTDEQVALEVVEAFLRRGALPWRHAGMSLQHVENQIDLLIARAPVALERLLRSLPVETTSRRVWLQVSPPVRRQALTVLGARRPDEIERLVLDWSIVLDAPRQAGPVRGAAAPGGGIGHAARKGEGAAPITAVPHRDPEVRIADPASLLFAEVWRALVEQTTSPIAERVARRAIALVAEALRAPEPAATASTLRAWLAIVDHKLAVDSPVRAAVREHQISAERAARKDTAGADSSQSEARAMNDVPRTDGPMPSQSSPAATLPSPATLRVTTPSIPWRVDAEVDAIWTPHAGLVIAWPFLQGLFTAVGLVVDQAFVDDEARGRAVLLAAYLADGETSWGEHELVMEKLLCGWPVDAPIDASIVLTEQEQWEVLDVLRSILTHWTALKSTSIEGLRQAFLRRPGTARSIASGWKVEIPRAGHDLLLEKLPWGIGLVMLPWMDQPLSIEW